MYSYWVETQNIDFVLDDFTVCSLLVIQLNMEDV